MAVEYFDERFTTSEADELLEQREAHQKQRQARRDQLAAQIMLDGYLEAGESLKRCSSDCARRGTANDHDKLIFGCGYLGRAASRGAGTSAGHEVAIVTRSERAGRRHSSSDGYRAIVADVTEPATLRGLPAAETVLFAVGFDRVGGQIDRRGLCRRRAKRARRPALRHRPVHLHQHDRRLRQRRR